MSKHTQQEWQRDGATVYALNIEGTNRFFAQVQGGWSTQGRNRTDVEEVEANARLIAAAPCSHAANVSFIEAMDALYGITPAWDDDRIYDELPSSGIAQAYFMARAAIAKAVGHE